MIPIISLLFCKILFIVRDVNACRCLLVLYFTGLVFFVKIITVTTNLI